VKSYPATTGLSAWVAVFVSLLREAREQLSGDEHEELLALLVIALAREVARSKPGTGEWLGDQMRRAA